MWQTLREIHFMFYVALVFILFPVVGVLTGEYSPLLLVWTAIFVWAYLSILVVEDNGKQWGFWFLLCVYIVYASLALNLGFTWYLFYLSNILIYRLHEHRLASPLFLSFFMVEFLIILGAVFVYEQSWEFYANLLIPLLFQNIIVLGLRRLQMIEDLKVERMRQNEKINLLLAESERNRIGRDLHDSLGHTFAMLSLKTELAQQFLQLKDLEELGKELEEIHEISRKSMVDVRRIVDNLKTRTLEEELATIEKMLEMTGVEVELTNELNVASLPKQVQINLSMILLELATNIIKHANARHCSIHLWSEAACVLLDVEDDGVGFKEVTGRELHSIRERLSGLDGQIDILSSAQPTLIRLTLPLKGGER
ncbi:sensor histidine kinase [Streptococcus oricebi]|uniref:histidine kinase n=1 Tax=Streptococcus oricebi TaxID=1547447 RepID=A0ABS5B5H0_9STRE|nr:sensor histidine kinase [Streptococcus oricebi]MBP2624070.1 sensor histidine kinase [Streptococcus oricebi]